MVRKRHLGRLKIQNFLNRQERPRNEFLEGLNSKIRSGGEEIDQEMESGKTENSKFSQQERPRNEILQGIKLQIL